VELSFREMQVADLVRQAKLNKEIAYELHLSEGTIKEYLNRIFRKLGTRNRTELALWVFRAPAERRFNGLHEAGASPLETAG
jgi:DNA-binding NarL/FixJ family response regulator